MTWQLSTILVLAYALLVFGLCVLAFMVRVVRVQNDVLLSRLSALDADLTHANAKRLELDAHLAGMMRTLAALTEELGLDEEEPEPPG
jgi:hypothetical protein